MAAKGFKYTTWLKRYDANLKWPERISLVGVLWQDACHSGDGEVGTIMSFIAGTVVKADATSMAVAFEVFDDKTTRDVTTIPASLIKKVLSLGYMDL